MHEPILLRRALGSQGIFPLLRIALNIVVQIFSAIEPNPGFLESHRISLKLKFGALEWTKP